MGSQSSPAKDHASQRSLYRCGQRPRGRRQWPLLLPLLMLQPLNGKPELTGITIFVDYTWDENPSFKLTCSHYISKDARTKLSNSHKLKYCSHYDHCYYVTTTSQFGQRTVGFIYQSFQQWRIWEAAKDTASNYDVIILYNRQCWAASRKVLRVCLFLSLKRSDVQTNCHRNVTVTCSSCGQETR